MLTIKVTGFAELTRRFQNSPFELNREMQKALGDSVAMVETESAKRTPVATGLLRASIGGARGWSWVRGWRASVGTNVNYAFFVHEGRGRHNVGERKFMTKGARASSNFIQRRMAKAMDNLAKSIAR